MINLCINLSAKEGKVKFGKLGTSDLKATLCPIDSNAHAYYIFDKGQAEFIYVNGFKIKFYRHFRIKILDETALDEASFEIPLYIGSQGNEEYFSGLKAITYNLVDGKVETTKFDKNNLIREKTSENRVMVKYALPNVRAGSVIEVMYSISSDFLFNLNGWQFQYEIPVLSSAYKVEIPQYFIYKQYPFGYVHYDTQQTSGISFIIFPDGSKVDFSTDTYAYDAVNVPAFPISEHLSSKWNYISRVEFELASTDYPNSLRKDYSSTWSKIVHELLEAENFGCRLNHSRAFKDQALVIKAVSQEAYMQMQSSFAYIKSSTKWNNLNRCYASQSFNKTLEKGIGNCADINLALVGLLREVGLEAHPVALSTRNNGFIRDYFPTGSQLNYVIAACVIGDDIYLLDATNDYSKPNVLPTRCLNGKGLVIDEGETQWLSLSNDVAYKLTNSLTLNLNDDGVLDGYQVSYYYDYAAYMKRNAVKDYESEAKYMEDYESDNEGMTIRDFSLLNVDSLQAKRVEIKMQIELEDQVELMGNMMIFSPMFHEGIYSNPLKLEERKYPVEYYYPTDFNERVVIKIPEGYVVESFPESVQYKSQNIGCGFKYIVQVQNNTMMVISQIQRSQVVFPYSQYDELKFFYETIAKKHNEKVVLKKVEK